MDKIIGLDKYAKKSGHDIKVLMAPINICGQASNLANALRKKNVYARLFQYSGNVHQYSTDMLMNPEYLSSKPNREIMMETADFFGNEDYDIIHFWQKSFVFDVYFQNFTGIDLPMLARSKKIIHRFTGWDLRRKCDNLKLNPYSAFRYGYELKSYMSDEERYVWLDYLRQFAEAFVVVDPEMQQYLPEAKIIPRTLFLPNYPYSSPKKNDIPVIVHAPTDRAFKGSDCFEKCLDELQSEGLKFKYIAVSGISNNELLQIIADADIVLDQLHLGWYGVFAMEAMALGTPVVTYINNDLESKFEEDIPVVNCNVDNVKKVLRKLITDYEWRKEIAEAGRKFVEKYHDVDVVSDNLHALYKSVLPGNEHGHHRKDNVNVSLEWFRRQTLNRDEVWMEKLKKRDTVWAEKFKKRDVVWAEKLKKRDVILREKTREADLNNLCSLRAYKRMIKELVKKFSRR